MERKSGVVWSIALTGHSHPNGDIVLYHCNLETTTTTPEKQLYSWEAALPPSKKNLCYHGGLDLPPTQNRCPEMAPSTRIQFANALSAPLDKLSSAESWVRNVPIYMIGPFRVKISHKLIPNPSSYVKIEKGTTIEFLTTSSFSWMVRIYRHHPGGHVIEPLHLQMKYLFI